jgi:hypothetical protein
MTDTDHYTAQDIAIDNHRMDLICAMNGALAALTRASTSLSALMNNQVYDVEFAEGTIGTDVAAFLDDSLRFTRAAYARTREVTDVC